MKKIDIAIIYIALTALSTTIWTICFIRNPLWLPDDEIAEIGHYCSNRESFIMAFIAGAAFSLLVTLGVCLLDSVTTKVKKHRKTNGTD